MNRTKLLSILIVLVLGTVTFAQESTEHDLWITNIEKAKELAADSDRIILMSFQGSDWCSNCKRLERKLFEDAAFQEFANENLVLLKVDFPMKKENRLSKDQTTHNELLAEEYNSDGVFPKVLLFNAKGELLGTLKYPQKEANEYLISLASFVK